MRKLLFFLFGLFAFTAFSQVTISEEEFQKLPESVQQQIRPEGEVVQKMKETSKAVSIGKEIGTAVNETLTAVSDNVIKVADSDVGKTAISIAVWKLLYKDILGIVTGVILFGFSMFFVVRATKKPDKDEDTDDESFTVRRVISGIAAAVLFTSSMIACFG